MIRRVARRTDRLDHVELSPTVLSALRDWLCARRAAACDEFEAVLSALPRSAHGPRDRLERLAAFHRDVESAIASAPAHRSDN